MNIFKKILLIIPLVLTSALFSVSAPFASAFDGRGTSGNEPCPVYLGLTTWDCNVSINDENSLKTGVWQIAANVATDITVIAGYLVIGYVIYGGYLYMLSGGDPGKVANGKKALTQAFIGLGIVMTAYVILNTIRVVLLQNSTFSQCDLSSSTGDTCINTASELNNLVTTAIQWAIGVSGIVAVIFIVYGGISYTTANGDPGKLQKAKQTILYALIGLIIVAIAEIITAFVSSAIREANNKAEAISYINQTAILKEANEINNY